MYKDTDATSKRTISSVVNGGYIVPNNVIWGSAFDCNSDIKNGRFYQFNIRAIKRTR